MEISSPYKYVLRTLNKESGKTKPSTAKKLKEEIEGERRRRKGKSKSYFFYS